jgi:hypothetical protein
MRSRTACGVDVLEVLAVALVADRSEALLHHHFGEAEDGVEGVADLVADAGEKLRLGGGRGVGLTARYAKLLGGLLVIGDLGLRGVDLRPQRGLAFGHGRGTRGYR